MINFRHGEEVHKSRGSKYLGDFVYGANGGIITTFAVVSGAAGASLPAGVVIVLGLANLIADGISMGMSDYLAIRSRRDFEAKQRAVEEAEVEKFPDKEFEEVRDIVTRWGFAGSDAENITKVIASNKKGGLTP